MLHALIAVLLAALVYWFCIALGLPVLVSAIPAIMVLIGGFGGVPTRRL